MSRWWGHVAGSLNGEAAAVCGREKETEHQQERQRNDRGWSESAQEEGAVSGHQAAERADHIVGYVLQEEAERMPRLTGLSASTFFARWVATAHTSPHVSGDTIDIGPSDATAWLSEHGAEYGLVPDL